MSVVNKFLGENLVIPIINLYFLTCLDVLFVTDISGELAMVHMSQPGEGDDISDKGSQDGLSEENIRSEHISNNNN